MTVTATSITPHLYTGNGVTTEWAVSNFTFGDPDDLVVTQVAIADGTETVLVYGTDFTMSADGLSVVISPALSSLYQLHIDRSTPITQALSLPSTGVAGSVYTDAWDKLTRICQEIKRLQDLSLRAPNTSGTFGELPNAIDRANNFLGFDASGDPIVSSGAVGGISVSSFVETLLGLTTAAAFMSGLGITAFAQTLFDDADAAAFIATLGITATVAEINTVADGITATVAEINTVADGIGVTIPRQKIVELGDWDMDTNDSHSVAHGLNLSQIIGVNVMIRNDADSNRFGGRGHGTLSDTYTELTIRAVGPTNLNFLRRTGGTFDSTDFDSTSYNRGWAIIFYLD